MEAIELIDRPVPESIQFDTPDTVIHIEFSEHPLLSSSHIENTVTNSCQQNNKYSQRDLTSVHKDRKYFKTKRFYKSDNQTLHKIFISTNTKTKKYSSKETFNCMSTNSVQTPILSPVIQRRYLYEEPVDFRNLHPHKKRSVDAETQTYISDYENKDALNIFCCTFHRNGDVETYCNIPNMIPLKHIEYGGTTATSKIYKQNIMNPSKIRNENKRCEEEEARVLIEPKVPLKRKKRLQVAKCTDDSSSSQMEVHTLEEDLSTEREAVQSVRVVKGYRLRTKRLFKKYSDMQYSFIQTSKKKIHNFGVLKCMHCSQEFSTFCRLEKHSKVVHDSSHFSFPCDLCGTTFTRPHNLRRHLETKHGEGERKYLCEHCGRRFNRQDILTSHTYLVHSKIDSSYRKNSSKKKRINQCTFCNKLFSRIQNFENHKKGNLNCSKCSQVFACKTGLRNHLYKHHSVSCGLCGKVCANKQQLYFHTLAHTPKFKCKYCNKGFIWESQFIVHLATHTGYKPLNCEICGKSFAHKNAVNKHKWQEHTEANKKFPCNVCGKSFVYKAKLISHSRSHTGEKPFPCHLCPSAFSQNCNLSAHVKSVHGIYLQSVKKDGQRVSITTVIKQKKVTKKLPQKILVDSQPQQHGMKPTPKEIVSSVNAQVYSGEVLSEPFSNGETVYQILYAYPSQ